MTEEEYQILRKKCPNWTDEEYKALMREIEIRIVLEKIEEDRAVAEKNADIQAAAQARDDENAIKSGRKKVVSSAELETIRVNPEESRDVREAYFMAENFHQNKSGDSYVLKEGHDVFYIIHGLVTLWRRCLALENFIKRLDKND